MGSTFGFIGTGNMGGALARAAAKRVPGERILLSNRTAAKSEALAEELGARAVDNAAAAAEADVLFLGVKPQGMAALAEELAPVLAFREKPCALVSMAAGLSLARLRELFGRESAVLRIMPNTPCAVGEGVILCCPGEGFPEDAREAVCAALAGAGRIVPVTEAELASGGVVSGCGPAFADLFLEALADGGVACGLPRAKAQELAAQMLLGAARLALETGQHPGALKDAVCSPGGSTIQGVRALERSGFRSAVIEAVLAADRRSREMS